MAYITLPSLSTNKVLTASYLNQLNDNIKVIGAHDHSGSLGEGASTITVSSSAASPHALRYEFYPFVTVPSSQNFSTMVSQGTTGSTIFGMHIQSGAACPGSAMFPVSLFAGVYKLEILHEKNTNLGIASVLVGTSVVGELDEYASVAACNSKTSFSASVPTTASYVITLRVDGNKNVSSTASVVKFQAAKIRKTGAY